jgi:hypothetical protein
VLVVTVTDAVNQAQAAGRIPFQILTDTSLRELLTHQIPQASDE